MKKILLSTFLLFFVPLQLFPQSKRIYYSDEEYKQINYTEFSKKVDSKLYLMAIFENDTAIFKKLRFKEYFGHLSAQKKTQLNKLFYKRFQIDSSKIWLIHYIDSIPNIKKIPKEVIHHFIDSINKKENREIVLDKESIKNHDYYYLNTPLYNDSLHGFLTKRIMNKKELFQFLEHSQYVTHRHINNYNNYRTSISKEKKKMKKYKKIILLHFCSTDLFNSAGKIDEKFFIDPNLILKKTFSDGMLMYNNIIIKPNGDFYLNSDFTLPNHIFNDREYQSLEKKWLKKVQKEY